jgi:hypothetical protein
MMVQLSSKGALLPLRRKADSISGEKAQYIVVLPAVA